MSSREIAELTGKEHKNVLVDIRKVLESLALNSADFSAVYKDATGRTLLCFRLPKRECIILVSGYDVNMRAKIVDRSAMRRLPLRVARLHFLGLELRR